MEKRTTVAAILAGAEPLVDLVEAKDAMVLAERELEAREARMGVAPARGKSGELEWAMGAILLSLTSSY